MFQTGRRFAYNSSALRSPTFTLVNPPPTGVVTGPLSATLLRRIESSSCGGSVAPYCSTASTPAGYDSQSASSPAVSRIFTTAPATSGPIPSPGMSVIVCVTSIPFRAAWPRRPRRFTHDGHDGHEARWDVLRALRGFFCGDLARPLLRERRRNRFEEPLVFRAERRGDVAVDVDLAEHLGAAQDRHDDLGCRFHAARQVPRVGVDIVDDDGGLLGRGRAADTATERNMCVRRRLAAVWAEDELVAEQRVNADPVIFRQAGLEDLNRARHGGIGVRRCRHFPSNLLFNTRVIDRCARATDHESLSAKSPITNHKSQITNGFIPSLPNRGGAGR